MSTSQPSIFITGISSGIGAALARAYLKRGATVYGLSRRSPSHMPATGSLHTASADLRHTTQVEAAMQDLLTDVPHLDLIVLNAGILGEIRDLRDTPLEDLREILEVNLWANKVVLDCLTAQSITLTQVITLSSGAAVNGSRGWGGYAISKAALNMLTQLYAAEMPETHFCALAPGLVDTAMQDHLCGLPPDPRFPSLGNLRERRNTPDIPKPEAAAERMLEAFRHVRDLPSGTFADIRELE